MSSKTRATSASNSQRAFGTTWSVASCTFSLLDQEPASTLAVRPVVPPTVDTGRVRKQRHCRPSMSLPSKRISREAPRSRDVGSEHHDPSVLQVFFDLFEFDPRSKHRELVALSSPTPRPVPEDVHQVEHVLQTLDPDQL